MNKSDAIKLTAMGIAATAVTAAVVPQIVDAVEETMAKRNGCISVLQIHQAES